MQACTKSRQSDASDESSFSTMAARIVGFTGHPVGEEKSGLAVGMDKGRALTKRELKPKPSYRKGVRAAS